MIHPEDDWLEPLRQSTERIRQKTEAIRQETERLRQQNASLRSLAESKEKLKQIVESSIINHERKTTKDTESPTTLKPCPFCGSKNLAYSGQNGIMSHLFCRNCGAHGPSHEPGGALNGLYFFIDDCGVAVIADAWNRRSGETSRTFTRAQPDPALLESMAMRYRHDFGLLDSKHQAAILVTMRQLWEEVAGVGFYRPIN